MVGSTFHGRLNFSWSAQPHGRLNFSHGRLDFSRGRLDFRGYVNYHSCLSSIFSLIILRLSGSTPPDARLNSDSTLR
jgi:hypothetical protein